MPSVSRSTSIASRSTFSCCSASGRERVTTGAGKSKRHAQFEGRETGRSRPSILERLPVPFLAQAASRIDRMKTVVSSLWKYIRRYRFRYDIFISYARADGSSYAKQLRERLKQLDFTAFLDETEITPGDPLRHSLRGALERSATLVIVGTPSAAKSLYIALEVGHFAATGRRIIPINVGGSITDAPWDAVRANELVWIDDAPEAFAHGSPGLSVAADIERFFEYRKRNSIQRLRTIGVALLFAVVTIASVFVIWRQIGNLRDEQQKSTRQEVEANLARALSRKKEREAQTQTRIAAAQTQIAADNRRTADERLIETTQEQGRYELLRGNRQQALISLAQVYHERP